MTDWVHPLIRLRNLESSYLRAWGNCPAMWSLQADVEAQRAAIRARYDADARAPRWWEEMRDA